MNRIYLSPPHIGELEKEYVAEAFATNWVSPLGPHVDAFEEEFAREVGAQHAVALSSGTAAIHLALIDLGIGAGDEVFVSTLTFAATVNPLRYVGATPAFIDSDRTSWNMDPGVFADAVRARARVGKLPKAVIVVHLYGQCADLDAIMVICGEYGITVIEDAAEALGSSYKGRSPGVFGRVGVFSFNGNKIITTSGGGMLVTDDRRMATHVRKLATQAREPAPHYEHTEIGYNYRLSNLLAGVGRGQLRVLGDRVAARRANFDYYHAALGDIDGFEFMPEAAWGRHTRWLTCLRIDEKRAGVDRETLRLALEEQNIEARPVWKPMHLQPVFREYPCYGGAVAADLFERGLCLPSGSSLRAEEREKVVATILDTVRQKSTRRVAAAKI